MNLVVEGMTCGGCARGVTRAIQAVDANAKVITDPPSRSVKVETTATQQQVVEALTEAGFPPR